MDCIRRIVGVHFAGSNACSNSVYLIALIVKPRTVAISEGKEQYKTLRVDTLISGSV